jgi:hypothetical protein
MLNAGMGLANVAAMGMFMANPASQVGMAALASTAGIASHRMHGGTRCPLFPAKQA